MFALMLFGVFMPMQVVLLPMSQVLGWIGIASLDLGPGAGAHHRRPALDDAVLPQLLLARLTSW